ncbi:hypothetical protein ACLOJD_08880 [Rothia dentocariosa]|uniref:hypothetical protein n=1 Tax=Rothia dentocariosa TaxID=2047 RepID=UPI0039A1E0DA
MREKNLKIEESHFYAFSRITRNFLVKHAVKLLVPSSRNESPAQFANLHSVMTLGRMSWSTVDSERARHQICVRKARKRRQVLFYEIVETAQAILINYILIDGSAQAVSHIVGFISAWSKSLR